MRKRIWIPCIVVLVVCLFLALKLPQQKQDMHSGPKETPTYQSSQAEHPTIVKPHQTTNSSNIPRMLALPPTATPLAKAVAKTNPYAGRVLALWQAPIEFYGKVVDENSNAVVGAQVSFHWMEIPANDGSRSSNVESGSDGLFSLRGAMGPSLTVSVNKNGYYTSRSTPDGFSYSLDNDTFHPDPQNPVIFSLRKKGVGESLIGVKQNYRVPRDGTPLGIDLTTGKAITGGSGNFVVQCWTEDQGKRSGQRYDWHCLVTIPSGGLVLSDEEFAFLAPENGYVLTNEIAMPADRPDWRNDVDLKFFYWLANGRYGRMTFSMIAGGDHFCMIDSVLNPSGSRNLEPAN